MTATPNTAALRALLERVEEGDCVALTVNGVTQYYRARKSADHLEDLTLGDLQHDPVSDANAMMARALAAPVTPANEGGV